MKTTKCAVIKEAIKNEKRKTETKKVVKLIPKKKSETNIKSTPSTTSKPAPELTMKPKAAPEQPSVLLAAQDKSAATLLKADRAKLLEALTVARDFIGKKNTLPILANVLLAAVEDEYGRQRLSVTATDIETAWTRSFPCEASSPISRCIPADLLHAEVKALSEDVKDVEITFLESSVQVNARCDIYTAPAEDYPAIPDVRGPQIDVSNLIEALGTVLPAVGESDSRYILNGACVDFRTGKVVGTDGHRLHMETMPPQDRDNLIIPRRAVELMTKHNAGSLLVVKGDRFTCSLAFGTMTGKLITGLFPDYSKVIPETNPIHVEFSAKDLLKVFEGALPLAKDKARTVKLVINGRMEVHTSNPERGEYKWYIDAKTTGKGEAHFTISFNADYLTDAIRAYTLRKGQDTVHMEMSEAIAPCVVNGKAVVMPMRGDA